MKSFSTTFYTTFSTTFTDNFHGHFGRFVDDKFFIVIILLV
jgi:hypothetical protein